MKKILYCILTMLLGVVCLCGCKDKGTSEESSKPSSNNSIEFVQNEITLSVGASVQAEVITSKNNVYVFWSTRDTNIATVSDKGVITAVAEGQTICYAAFGGETAICLIKVTADKTKPMLSVTSPYEEGITIFVGDTFNPLFSVKLGDDACDGATMQYNVSNAAVASVVNGELVACGVGEATLSVEVTYDGQTVSLTIPVSVVEFN